MKPKEFYCRIIVLFRRVRTVELFGQEQLKSLGFFHKLLLGADEGPMEEHYNKGRLRCICES